MNKYCMRLSYDGTAYGGWQVQPNVGTIQEQVQDVLYTIFQEKILLIAAGRTDAGVHAKGQMAHFEIGREVDLRKLLRGLNGILPEDIRILDIWPVASDFSARYDAKSKVYRYYLCLNPVSEPFRRLYSLHIRHKLDLELLQEAAKHFVGEHDFTSFANDADSGSAAKNPIREIRRLSVIEEGNGYVCLEFEGKSFLYKMVRNIVGLLLDIGRGKRSIEDIRGIFAAKDRCMAGRAAPAHGLFLMSVDYEKAYGVFESGGYFH